MMMDTARRLSGVLALCSVAAWMQPPAKAQDSNKDTPPTGSASAADFAELKARVAAQDKQIEQLRLALADLAHKQDHPSQAASAAAPSNDFSLPNAPKLGEVASATPMIPSNAALTPASLSPQDTGGQKVSSPLYFEIGTAKFSPLGFIDVTNVFRSTGVGSGIGTGFGGIPFGSAPAGQLTESRLSLQNSRVGLRIDSKAFGGDAIGYLETDFLGNAPANLAVTSNSNTLRMRLFWFDWRKDKFEFLAGQTWSLLTPNRKGLSPLPGDLFYSQDVDTNYQVGLAWTRAPEFRFVYHANDHVAAGVALEAPEQYVGGATTYPAALAAGLAKQFDDGTTTTSVPNLHPDIIGKVALDGGPDGHAVHFEFGGIYRTFQAYDTVTGQKNYKGGGGGTANFNFEVARGFRLIGTTFFGSGIGRYVGTGLGPDVVIRPNGTISTVDAGAAIGGFEYSHKPANSPKNLETLFYAYYGGTFFRNNFFADANGKNVGFGYPGSSSSANRSVQEYTAGITQTLWKNAAYGDLKFMTQYSYLTRSPWAPPATGSDSASTNMLFINLRYDIP